MKTIRALLLDATFILLGAGLSILFVSTDGNGRNPLPVAAQALVFVAVNGLVSFIDARFIRSVPAIVIASIFVTDLIFVLLIVLPAIFSPLSDAGEQREKVILAPVVFVVYTAPMVVLSSIGFARVWHRFYQKNSHRPHSRNKL
jgi:hypothetical protein